MEVFKICGPTVFEGEIRVQGSKNAALPMMAAAVVGEGITVIDNCPDISDVRDAMEILEEIGCKTEFSDGSLTIDSSGEIKSIISPETMSRIRASFVFTGALVARCRGFEVSQPGGCNIGMRPVDIHLDAMRSLGATVEMTSETISCRAEKLIPCDISLRFPSVGATENIMILASSLSGTTRIINCAREPEIKGLQDMLNLMGAHVTGAGTSVIVVEGRESLTGCRMRVMPDRIDTATALTALACSSGSLTIRDTEPNHLLSYINILRKCGMHIDVSSGIVYAEKKSRLKGSITASTAPYPGFATDMQSLAMSALSLTEGVSLIKENIFENRFCLARSLISMGADIRIYGRTASVRGVRSLSPTDDCVCDLRSGAALAAAMMSCEGESHLGSIHYIDRGYEKFEERYTRIGAHIERIEYNDVR